jgi:hypothetical protein
MVFLQLSFEITLEVTPNGAADEPRDAEARSADASDGPARLLAGGERQ